MGDFKEFEITVIIREKEIGGVYSDAQQEQAVRTIVRDETFNWSDNIQSAAEKVKNMLASAMFADI